MQNNGKRGKWKAPILSELHTTLEERGLIAELQQVFREVTDEWFWSK
jgi:hypothetical protein